MRSLSALLFVALTSLADVEADDDFIEWTQADLQTVLPHGAFICGAGTIDALGIKPCLMLSHHFPQAYLASAQTSDGGYRTSTLSSWLQSGKPQMVDADSADPSSVDAWQEAFRASGLRNIAAHGVIDSQHRFASYFSFHQVPQPLGPPHERMLSMIVPGMHAAVLRIIQNTVHASNETQDSAIETDYTPIKTLSPREREVLAWLERGKTSYEIARILDRSEKTIKNQVQAILVKLRVNTRAQAVAKGIRRRLLV